MNERQRELLSDDGVFNNFKLILDDLVNIGRTVICPFEYPCVFMLDPCGSLCGAFFKKADGVLCPCDCYSVRYLIKKVKKIIKDGESIRKEEK